MYQRVLTTFPTADESFVLRPEELTWLIDIGEAMRLIDIAACELQRPRRTAYATAEQFVNAWDTVIWLKTEHALPSYKLQSGAGWRIYPNEIRAALERVADLALEEVPIAHWINGDKQLGVELAPDYEEGSTSREWMESFLAFLRAHADKGLIVCDVDEAGNFAVQIGSTPHWPGIDPGFQDPEAPELAPVDETTEPRHEDDEQTQDSEPEALYALRFDVIGRGTQTRGPFPESQVEQRRAEMEALDGVSNVTVEPYSS